MYLYYEYLIKMGMKKNICVLIFVCLCVVNFVKSFYIIKASFTSDIKLMI